VSSSFSSLRWPPLRPRVISHIEYIHSVSACYFPYFPELLVLLPFLSNYYTPYLQHFGSLAAFFPKIHFCTQRSFLLCNPQSKFHNRSLECFPPLYKSISFSVRFLVNRLFNVLVALLAYWILSLIVSIPLL
jgi:hypothetical protein